MVTASYEYVEYPLAKVPPVVYPDVVYCVSDEAIYDWSFEDVVVSPAVVTGDTSVYKVAIVLLTIS